MGSGEVQPWNDISTEGEEETMNRDTHNGKHFFHIMKSIKEQTIFTEFYT